MKYRKKPVVVEAVQWFKHGDHPAVGECLPYDPDMGVYGWIKTPEGGHVVTPSDWIVTYPRGGGPLCRRTGRQAWQRRFHEGQAMTSARCHTCGRDPLRMNSAVAECSHVECPHRRRAWSERPTPAQLFRGPWPKNVDEDPKPLDASTKESGK